MFVDRERISHLRVVALPATTEKEGPPRLGLLIAVCASGPCPPGAAEMLEKQHFPSRAVTHNLQGHFQPCSQTFCDPCCGPKDEITACLPGIWPSAIWCQFTCPALFYTSSPYVFYIHRQWLLPLLLPSHFFHAFWQITLHAGST